MKKIRIYALPGWGFSAALFDFLTTRGFDTVGLNYMNAPSSTLTALAERVSNSIPEDAILLGWSFGGLLGMQLTALFPTKVSKLILISSQPRFLSAPGWEGISEVAANHFMQGLRDNPPMQIARFISFINYPDGNLKSKAFLRHHFLHDELSRLSFLLLLLFKTDLREVYMNLNAAVLHIINGQDAVIKQNENQLKILNSNIKITRVEKAGHAGFLNERNLYQNIIEDFVLQ